MNYAITFADVMATVLTLGIGALGFFLKRWFAQIEDSSEKMRGRIEEVEDSVRRQVEKNNDKINERINKLEDKTERDIQEIKHELTDIKGDFATTFVLREDFFRSMNSVEAKINGIDQKMDKLLIQSAKKD